MTSISTTARRSFVASTVVGLTLVVAGGTAVALELPSTPATPQVSVPQLQPTTQLPSAPQVSVPQVSVPQVSVPQVSTPSLPHVSTPSAPSVSAPSVRTPSLPHVGAPSSSSAPRLGSGSSGAASGGGSTGGGANAGGSAGSRPAAGGGAGSAQSGGGHAAATPAQRRRARAYDRSLRADVIRLRGCLSSLPTLGRRLLSLRAGLNGRPQSRQAAAHALGISLGRAARVERRSLHTLRSGCTGGSFTTSATDLSQHIGSIPQLQPAAAFVAEGAPPFMEPAKLAAGGPAGARQQVAGVHASSPSGGGSGAGGGRAPILATQTGDVGSGGPSSLLVLLLVLGAMLVAFALIGVRRAALAARGPSLDRMAPVVAAPAAAAPAARPQTEEPPPQEAAPAPEPAPAAEPQAEPQPQPQPAATAMQEPPRHDVAAAAAATAPHHSRVNRPAAMIASGLVTIAARSLVRRRRGRRRR